MSEINKNQNPEYTSECVVNTMLKKYPNIKCKVKFSGSLYKDALDLCENVNYKLHLLSASQNDVNLINSGLGLYIMPADLDSFQYVLISDSLIDENHSYISTVAHEVQHAINHTAFAQKYCNGCFEDIISHHFSVEFQIWDEFIAKSVGHSAFISCVLKNIQGYEDSEIIDFLTKSEAKSRASSLEQLCNNSFYSVETLKEIAGILGTFSAWKSTLSLEVKCLDFKSARFIDLFNSCKKTVDEVDFDYFRERLEMAISGF